MILTTWPRREKSVGVSIYNAEFDADYRPVKKDDKKFHLKRFWHKNVEISGVFSSFCTTLHVQKLSILCLFCIFKIRDEFFIEF
jgi:hypothetical protein